MSLVGIMIYAVEASVLAGQIKGVKNGFDKNIALAAFLVKNIIVICIFVTELLCIHMDTYGYDGNYEDYEKYENELSEYDFTDIDKALNSENIDFKELVLKLAQGNSDGVFYEIFTMI